jgi:hypothetical protein
MQIHKLATALCYKEIAITFLYIQTVIGHKFLIITSATDVGIH